VRAVIRVSRAEAQVHVLMRDLNYRTKNIFIVQAIAR
jgi:hypothetical protein